LRKQALAWLRADLALRTRRFQEGTWGIGTLTFWQRDDALGSVRDRAALAKLPESERKQWQQLWADVAAVLASDPLEQGRAHAARRHWRQAADCYAQALKRGGPGEGHLRFEHAAVLLLCGDRKGYRDACAHLVSRLGKTPQVQGYAVVRACTLAPESIQDPRRVGQLADKDLKASATAFWSLTQQGALHYRAGRFKEAVPLFQQSLRVEHLSGRAVLNWLWLALACQKLGKAEQARRWLDRAGKWLDQHGDGMTWRAEQEQELHLHNWLEAHILRREAEALLEAPAARRK
jgi:tetratricopeptide (TPR) repeat protein